MTFLKGNQLWRKALDAREKKNEQLANFLASGAREIAQTYEEKLIKQAEGEDLTKAEREFMDRYEGWREFITPKLVRTDNTNKNDSKINQSLTVKFE